MAYEERKNMNIRNAQFYTTYEPVVYGRIYKNDICCFPLKSSQGNTGYCFMKIL